MDETRHPSPDEVTLGALLHDIGKFMQRAHGTIADLPGRSREMDNVLCPLREGRYSHKHILWTDAFFEWMEGKGLSFPQGVDRQQVRDFPTSTTHRNAIRCLPSAGFPPRPTASLRGWTASPRSTTTR